MKIKNKCPHCKGTGEMPSKRKLPRFKCQECNGSGERNVFEMVVWRYDQFPYVLVAPGFIEDNGCAYVPTYQSYLRPIAILSLKNGAELKSKLDALESERDQAINILTEGFNCRLKAIFPKALT